MSKYSCAIVDDDPISLKLSEKMANKTELLTVKGLFNSPSQAIPWLTQNPVDLLLLDIEMPDMNGLEMLKLLQYKPEVIVMSGNPNYAVNAFESTVTDFLVKSSMDYGRFLCAISKVATKKDTNQPKPHSKHLFVKEDNLLIKIEPSIILCIEAFGDYVKIYTTEKIHIVHTTLKYIGSKLDDQKFVRAHRSYIINIDQIKNIDSSTLEIAKKIIPIGDNYKEALMKHFLIL